MRKVGHHYLSFLCPFWMFLEFSAFPFSILFPPGAQLLMAELWLIYWQGNWSYQLLSMRRQSWDRQSSYWFYFWSRALARNSNRWDLPARPVGGWGGGRFWFFQSLFSCIWALSGNLVKKKRVPGQEALGLKLSCPGFPSTRTFTISLKLPFMLSLLSLPLQIEILFLKFVVTIITKQLFEDKKKTPQFSF